MVLLLLSFTRRLGTFGEPGWFDGHFVQLLGRNRSSRDDLGHLLPMFWTCTAVGQNSKPIAVPKNGLAPIFHGLFKRLTGGKRSFDPPDLFMQTLCPNP